MKYLVIKRVIDFTGALIGIILLSPVLIITALLIKLTSKGPIFYKSKRVGKDGKLFTMLKFRTMHVNADSIGPKLTYRNDPRITKIGRYLRQLKIDELPQLFNVLKGEMSLVGPRPEDPKYIVHYSEKQKEILSIKPGITGLAQLKYINIESMLDHKNLSETYVEEIIPEKYKLNREYLNNASFSLDLKIMLNTIFSIFKTKHKI